MTNYLWIVVILIIFLCIRKKRRTAAAVWQIQNRRKQNKEILVMKELAKQFIGEECIIYTITSNDGSVQGVIKEIDDGGMIIERNSGEREVVNLDFVTRIREYPRNKKGKKKSGRPAVLISYVVIICPCRGISFSASVESSVFPLPEAV